MFKQMKAYRGFKLFGKRALAEMVKGLKQLYGGAMPGNNFISSINPYVLSGSDKEKALDAVNLIKNKRDGTIKGITCANGNKQIKYLSKGEIIASPTVLLETLFTTLLIDTYEERDVTSFDVPGA